MKKGKKGPARLGEIGFCVWFDFFEIGSERYMLSFFSTVAYRLESGNWGKRFPRIMKELYMGKLSYWHLKEAEYEMQIIEQEMKAIPAAMVIWDNDDPKKVPANPDEGNPKARNLAKYFVCTEGDSIFEMFQYAVEDAREMRRPVRLINLWLDLPRPNKLFDLYFKVR